MTHRVSHKDSEALPAAGKGRQRADMLVRVSPPPVSGGSGAVSAANTQLANLILGHARDGIALLDIYGRIQWMNPALETMLGWPLSEVRGRNPAELINPPETRPSPAALANFRYDPDSSLFKKHRVSRHMRRDGSLFWNQQSHALINLGPGDAQKMVVVTCRDISDEVSVQNALHRIKDELDHAAHHDELTGLGNRKKLSQYLASGAAMASLQAGTMGVLQLDMDKFKEINDSHGHAAGDAVLRHIAAALLGVARDGDLACRMGGDEFRLICLGVPDSSRLMQRAEAVLGAASRPLSWRHQMILPAVSIGASMASAGDEADTLSSEALMRRADHALYSAKQGGRGRAVLYTAALGRRYRAEQMLSRDLREAIEKQQFCVYLQPFMHISKGRVRNFEALLRWRHPTRGLLAPEAFLPAAQQAQLLSKIDYLALNAALDALAALHAAGFTDVCMALNASDTALADASYPALLDWALQSRGLSPKSICIEILETTIMNCGKLDISAAVTRLRRLGVRLALGDFGAGYAGLAHLSALEINTIKLDRSIVRHLQHDERARIITRSIIRLCRHLGIEVIAEGVETQEQLDILRRVKCPQAQGNGLAPPMPLPEFCDWLRAQVHCPGPITLLAEPTGDHASNSFDPALAPLPRANITDITLGSRVRQRDTSN